MELDELEGGGPHSSPLAVAAGAVGLAIVLWFAYKADVKVKNEIKMTDAYVRQAVAQERIADAIAPVQFGVYTYGADYKWKPVPTCTDEHKGFCQEPVKRAVSSGYWPSHE